MRMRLLWGASATIIALYASTSVSLGNEGKLDLPGSKHASVGASKTTKEAQAEPAKKNVGVRPSSAAASVNASTEAEPMIETVVVQARRTSENQQNVPIAISTVSADRLTDAAASYVGDIQKLVPTLQVQQGVTGQTDFLIRGTFSGFGSDPAVVTYVDDVPLDSRTIEYSLFDLSSVQVLKGPQGTLFGRNSTGGAVLFFSQRPDFSGVSGYIDGRYGNYNERRLEGAINVPVTDTLAVRAAGEIELRDGIIDSVTSPGRDYGNHNNHALRLSALWQPNNAFENYFQYTDYLVHENRMPRVAISYECPSLACEIDPTFIPYNDQQLALPSSKTVNSSPDADNVTSRYITDTATVHLGSVNFRNTFHYGFSDILFTNDYDGTPAQVVDAVEHTKTTSYYEEMQAFGQALHDRLNWRLGAVYSHDSADFENDTIIFPAFFPLGAPDFVFDRTSFASRAVFGEVTYDLAGLSDLLSKFSLTAGYRYTWDDRTMEITNFGGAPTPVCQFQEFGANGPTGVPYPNTDLSTCTRHLALNSSNSNYNLTLSYHPMEQWLIYGSIRKGYKSGSFNTLTPPGVAGAALATYTPEVVKSYELGTKADFSLGDVPIRANLALFRSKYDNIQITQTYIGSTVAIIVANTDPTGRPNKATIQGYELELTALPTSWLDLTAFYSRVFATYDSFTDQSGVNLSGQNVDGVVPITYGMTAGITFPWTGPYDDLRLTTSYYYAAAHLTNAETTTQNPALRSLDARLEAHNLFNSGADLSLWGKNLTDDRSCNLDPLVSGQITAQCDDPTTYGVEIRYHF